MTERINFTLPEQAAPGTLTWTPIFLHLNWEQATIKIGFRGDNGEGTSVSYEGIEANSLLTTLDKANLPGKSLRRRVMEKIIADGKLSGTISGIPD